MNKLKKGVSLVTVLLFMMVATIAATATFKWLSSVGESSAARLELSEARTAAKAGIDAARSWMSFNGNDVGALINQYFENSKKPIFLNPVLPRLTSSKMKDSVWLVGVSTEKSNYKLKILSVGTTRDNAKYSEMAVFNVSGLYQVRIPSQTQPLNYKEAFHGGLTTADVINVDAAIIKQTPDVKNAGGQGLNEIKATDYLILDGNFYVNDQGDVEDLYVTGDLAFGNHLNVDGKLYVGETLYGTASANQLTVNGTAYLKGGMRPNNRPSYIALDVPGFANPVGGQFVFKNNVTSGTIEHLRCNNALENERGYILMESNLVLNGQLIFPNGIFADCNNSDSLRVMGNTYISENSSQGKVEFKHIRKTFFGSSPEHRVSVNGFGALGVPADYCGENGLYKCAKAGNSSDNVVHFAYMGSLAGVESITDEEKKKWGADSLKKYYDKIAQKDADDVVQDPIQFNTALLNSRFVHNSSNPRGCNEDIWKANMDNPVELLNACYSVAEGNNNLFDNSWLIVEFSSAPEWKKPIVGKLSHNFIFIVNSSSAPIQEWELPETTDEGQVFLYLPNGWPNTNPEKGIITSNTAVKPKYNYFIYSDGNIGRFDTKVANPISLQGSIFLSGANQLNSAKGNNTLAIRFNQSLVEDLVNSHILCNYDGSGLCSGFSGVDEGTTVISELNRSVDAFYIATAPQLAVTVESEYNSRENISRDASDFDMIQKTAIVLPRVVYLTRDPVGRLADYYNVIGLNGSDQRKSSEKMSCPSQIKTGSQLLNTSGSLLEEGVFVCSYAEDEKKKRIPLYVVVRGLKNEQVEVSFDKSNKEIVAGYTANVVLQAKKSDAPVTVQILAPLSTVIPDGWTYAPANAGGTLTKLAPTANNEVYSFTYTPDGNDMAVFTVSTETYADLSTMTFQLVDNFCENCTVKIPNKTTIYISNRVRVLRSNFGSDLCSNPDRAAKFKSIYGQECSDVITWPSCEPILQNDPEWVKINGCAYITKNNSWNCVTDGQNVRLSEAQMGDSKCQVLIPDSTLAINKANVTYILPAMIKRKQIDVRVDFKGDWESTRAWVVYDRPHYNNVSSYRGDTAWCSSIDGCVFKLFAGDQVTVGREKVATGRSNYLVCKGDDCFKRDSVISSNEIRFTLGGTSADTVEFHIGEKDKHCFYTDFDTTKAWCTNEKQTDCIGYCYGEKSNCALTDVESKFKNAEWIMVHQNRNKVGWGLLTSDGYDEPIISNGYISAPKIRSSDWGRRRASVILNTAVAGYNGKYTAMFKVPWALEEMWDQIRNNSVDDGFIFRSNKNATDYFMISVLSRLKYQPDGYWTYARICHLTGRDSRDKCQEKPFMQGLNDNEPIVMRRKTSNTSINVYMHENMVTATLHYNFGTRDVGSAIVEFNLAESFSKYICASNDEACKKNHEYVGIKFDNRELLESIFQGYYELFDVGWASETYADSCWNTPSVTCSFKANYAKGMVPKDSIVTPWVGMSSWFDGKDCEVSYFYNGCDLREDLFDSGNRSSGLSSYGSCETTRDKGYYKYSAQKLDLYRIGKLKNEDYWFKEDGYHGYPYPKDNPKGYVNEASVLVYCTGEGANGHTYPASCGDFIVGTYEQCSENYDELLSEIPSYCHAETCSPDLAIDSVINARDATIEFTIAGLNNNGSVEVYLMDADSNYSAKAMTISEAGTYNFEVSSVSENGGFNPQRVFAVAFVPKGATNYSVTHIKSSCPYAFGLHCHEAAYNSQSKQWSVSADVLHPEKAKECAVKGNGSAYLIDVPDPQPCSGFRQEIEQDDVYGQLDEREYFFTVYAYDENGQVMDSCETPKATINPLEIRCSISENEVDRADGIPSFSFDLSGCPDGGCPYTIIYPDGSTVQGTGTSVEDICPTKGCRLYNTKDDQWSEGEYSYDVDVYGNHCLGNNMFTVLPEPPDANCTAKIEDGVFKADVFFEGDANPASWKGYYQVGGTGTFAFTDPMGVVIGKPETVKMTDRTFSKALPQESQTCSAGNCHYYAILRLHGDDTHFCSVEWDVHAQLTDASCPADINNQDPTKEMVIEPNMNGCEESDCSWEISRGSYTVKTGMNYNGKDKIAFTDNGVAGPRTYELKVSVTKPEQQTKKCTFNVSFDNSALSAGCSFTSYQLSWGETGVINIDGNCENCKYVVKSPSGQEVATGKTNGNDLTTDVPVRLDESGVYSVYLNNATSASCVAEALLPDIGSQVCTVPSSLSLSGSGTFTATIDVCANGDCKWPYVLKKDGASFSTGETGREVSLGISGPGTYALFLNGGTSPVCEKTVESKNDCYIKDKKSSYKYGEYFTFVVEDFTKERGDYYLTDPSGNNVGSRIHCGSRSPCEGGSYNISDAKAVASGTYKFAAKGNDCSDDIVVKPRSLSCTKSGNTLYIQSTGCENTCRAYYKKEDDNWGIPFDIKDESIVEKTIGGYGGGPGGGNNNSTYVVYFDGASDTTYCNGQQGGSSSSSSAKSSSSSAGKQPKLKSCSRSGKYLNVVTEGCENGCTVHYQYSNMTEHVTDITANTASIYTGYDVDYNVWLAGGNKINCRK